MHAERRQRLRALLAEHDLAALLVTDLVNVRYLTGFTGSAGQLLVTADPDADRFVTDGRYAQQAAGQVADVACLVNPGGDWLAAAVHGRLGLEAHAVSWQQARSVADRHVETRPAPRLVEQLRQVKDDVEVDRLRAACALADDAFEQLVQWLRPGMTEQQVGRFLDRTMEDAGADAPAFDTIVAFGANAAVPHHRPTGRELTPGDIVKVDFGARVDGYHSDMTRMLSVGALPAPVAAAYDAVAAAQRAGVAAARDGTATGEVDAACRQVLDEAGLGQRFVHGTGHGVGLQIHEDPFLRPARARPEAGSGPSVTLRAGMTVTVEPGVYLPGVGGVRIEDTLLIAHDGPDVLTRTPKDLVVL
ncbi:MAG TPA: Xaa-Pro peptidase family protein [Egibacteraceae bacterium]|nr:Xaa-Pro peptidase family protein [Egibacteraceae bacterium]